MTEDIIKTTKVTQLAAELIEAVKLLIPDSSRGKQDGSRVDMYRLGVYDISLIQRDDGSVSLTIYTSPGDPGTTLVIPG